MTKKQISQIIQFCKANKLPRPNMLGEREQYAARWFRGYDCTYSDYIAAMTFLVSLMKERDVRKEKQNPAG